MMYTIQRMGINASTQLKYDQFTREQIAGDLLPNSTDDQKVASGYNRLLQQPKKEALSPKSMLQLRADRVRNVSSGGLEH